MIDERAKSEATPSYELTAEERGRVMAEETFRRIVREELEATSKRPNSKTPASIAWAFLNSTFGVFFLGTIVVGLATWAAGVYEKQNRMTVEQAALIQKLDVELSYRLMPLASLFQGPKGSLDERVQIELASVVFSSEPPSKHNFMVMEARNLYPEFRDKNLSALLIELRFVAPRERGPELRKAAAEAARMERLLKGVPRKRIQLAEHVIGEVTELTPAQVAEIKRNVVPAFQAWLQN